jgi:hypothetical protein
MVLNICFDLSVINTQRNYLRQSRRVKMSQPVRIAPSGPKGESFEEIGMTSNVSREGFYFLTRLEHYLEGMRLRVTLPYHIPPDRRDREYLAQIVRIELLSDGQRGVAVRLLPS